jgi:hypothetical protein
LTTAADWAVMRQQFWIAIGDEIQGSERVDGVALENEEV